MSDTTKTIRSICIVRLSALGDVLMCLPAVRRLQETYPYARISWVISRPAYDLLEGIEGIEFIVINKPSGPLDYVRFYRRMRGRRFDILLAAQASLRANLLYPSIRARRKIGYDSLRAKDGHFLFVNETIPPGEDHTLEGFLKFASQAGAQSTSVSWNLAMKPEHRAFAHDILPKEGGPILLVNPAASKPERTWPVERYIEVMRFAKEQWDCQLVLIGGPGAFDRALADAILQEVEALDLVGKTKPAQLLAIMERADVVLCPDTGPSHMAAAVNTPVVALHAVTSAQVSGPYPFRHLAVDYYEEAVQKILGKPRSSVPWGTHIHGSHTMALVPVQPVLHNLAILLRGNEKDQSPEKEEVAFIPGDDI